VPTVEVGSVITLYAKVNPDGGGDPADPIAVTWSVDTPAVATVEDSPGTTSGEAAQVTGVSVGTANVTGVDGKGLSETIAITVVAVGEPAGGFTILTGPGVLP
jgi:uncharacterized protein YjdB